MIKTVLLYELAASNDLWRQRIAVIATFYFIKQNDFGDTLRLAELLMDHEHHLIHKAVGWMLREIGNRDLNRVVFLEKQPPQNAQNNASLCIEKFDSNLRRRFLAR